MTIIVLQGLPGIGKTTLTKKIASKLKEMAVKVTGFYTEELRDEKNYRVGFDVVTLDDKRGILARKSSTGTGSKHKVGTYNVQVDDFEKIALPVLDNVGSILIIDEIGKMELLSKKFEARIEQIISDKNIRIVASVPLKGGGHLVQKLKTNTSNKVITVNVGNRNQLLEEIIALVLQ